MILRMSKLVASSRLVGARWRSLRVELDLSTDQASARLKISAGYLRAVEAGTPGNEPSERLIHRASRLYGVTFDWLIGKDDPPAEPEPTSVPDRGHPEPKVEPTGPPPRRDDRRGPPRADDLRAAS